MSKDWRKSTYCDTSACVEVRTRDGMIEVRDSKNPENSVLRFTSTEWLTFVRGAEDGKFDV